MELEVDDEHRDHPEEERGDNKQHDTKRRDQVEYTAVRRVSGSVKHAGD